MNQQGTSLESESKRNPSPNVSRTRYLLLDVAVLLFRINEGPDFITLDALALQIHKSLVLIHGAGAAKIDKQLHYGRAMNTSHACNGSEGVALD
jgi:hypothetical protein